MAEKKPDYYEELLPWFELKVSEFSKEGYPNIETENIYLCFKNFVWKHTLPEHYYQRVFDIMKFSVNQYFDYESLEAQIYNVSSLEDIDFNDFL